MDIKNLSRAAEINTYLPAIDEARKAISGGKASVRIVTQAGLHSLQDYQELSRIIKNYQEL